MAIDGGSSSSQVLVKRDHEGDVDMNDDFSPENVSRCGLLSHVTPSPVD
jgi:hypothetical protein